MAEIDVDIVLGDCSASTLPAAFNGLHVKLNSVSEWKAAGESLIVGDDGGGAIVWARGALHSEDGRFINSDVSRFIECLKFFERLEPTSGAADSDRVRACVLETDSAALENAESWWSVVIEQMVDELL